MMEIAENFFCDFFKCSLCRNQQNALTRSEMARHLLIRHRHADLKRYTTRCNVLLEEVTYKALRVFQRFNDELRG